MIQAIIIRLSVIEVSSQYVIASIGDENWLDFGVVGYVPQLSSHHVTKAKTTEHDRMQMAHQMDQFIVDNCRASC
jgi:hypothetical protein